MTLEFTLARKIAVQRFDLVATIAREQERPELSPVLLWARQRSESDLDFCPKELAQHLLGPGTGMVTVAARLLRICKDLQLILDDDSGLTEEGLRASDERMILLPDKGKWTIWATDDPLLPFPIIGAIPSAEARPDKTERNPRGPHKDLMPLPEWLLEKKGWAAPMLSDSAWARFDDISAPAIHGGTTSWLELQWTFGGKPDLRVVGTIDGQFRVNRSVFHPELPSTDDVWKQLLDSRHMARSWDASRSSLRIPFKAATSEDERINMRARLQFKSPQIKGLGAFNDTSVENVPLCPDSPGCASEWAKHQIVAQLSGVQTEGVYASLAQQVRARFADWQIDVPSREELARELESLQSDKTRRQAWWSLQAALDWRL